jgi:hypothetical protein
MGMANDFIGPGPIAIGIANGLILTELIAVLKDKGVLTPAEALDVVSGAAARIDPGTTIVSERDALPLLKKLADRFKVDGA